MPRSRAASTTLSAVGSMTPGLSSTVARQFGLTGSFRTPSRPVSTRGSRSKSFRSRSACSRANSPSRRQPRALAVMGPPSWPCVSRLNSSQTRRRSASSPSGRISISQSMAFPRWKRRSVELDLHQELLAIAENVGLDGVALLLPAQEEHVGLEILDRLAVHLDDAIALAEAGAGRGQPLAHTTDQHAVLVVDVVGP